MKIKSFFLVIFLSCTFFIGIGQTIKLTNDESIELKNRVIEKSKNINTIYSEFIQYKHLDFLENDIESSGIMAYKSPNFIKWQYKEPFKYSAIFKNDKLYVDDNGIKSNLDLSSNKLFKSLNNLIVKSIKGDMFDLTKFDIIYYKDSKNYIVSFSPIDKSMKSLIKEFVLTFDSISFDVKEVKMVESSDDYTRLLFINQKFNESVSDAVFSN